MQKQDKKLTKSGMSTLTKYSVPAGAAILVAMYIALLIYRSGGQKYVWKHTCTKNCCATEMPKKVRIKPCESNSLFKKDTYYYE